MFFSVDLFNWIKNHDRTIDHPIVKVFLGGFWFIHSTHAAGSSDGFTIVGWSNCLFFVLTLIAQNSPATQKLPSIGLSGSQRLFGKEPKALFIPWVRIILSYVCFMFFLHSLPSSIYTIIFGTIILSYYIFGLVWQVPFIILYWFQCINNLR